MRPPDESEERATAAALHTVRRGHGEAGRIRSRLAASRLRVGSSGASRPALAAYVNGRKGADIVAHALACRCGLQPAAPVGIAFPGARPNILGSLGHQSGLHRVVLDGGHEAFHFPFLLDHRVVGFPLPETPTGRSRGGAPGEGLPGRRLARWRIPGLRQASRQAPAYKEPPVMGIGRGQVTGPSVG